MKLRKRIVAFLILIAMFISNLIFPLQGIVYADNEKTINFTGNDLVVNNDGSVTFNCDVEDNTGRLTFTLYNSENQIVGAQPMEYWDEGQQMNVPNGREAWANLNSTSYEGFYFIVTSDDVDLSTIKFDFAGQYYYVANDGRLNIPTDVEHLNVDAWNIRPLHEKKEVTFYSNNLTVNQDGSANMYCELEYNTGIIKVYLYNSDGTQVNIQKQIWWDSELEQNYESDTSGFGKLNTTTYEGAYLMVSSNEVDLTDVKLDIAGKEIFIGQDGRINLPNEEHIDISSNCFREINEKKQIGFHSENLEIDSDGRITVDCNLEYNSGRLTITPYNSDGSIINVRKYDRFNDETQEWEYDHKNAFGKVNGTTYDGAYLIVTSDEVDLTDLKFDFSGRDCLIGENGRVDLTGCDFVHIDEHTYRLVHEKKRVDFRSDHFVLNQDGTVTMDTEIEGNEGQLNFELHNADGSKVNIENVMGWNEELEQPELDTTRGEGKLNTTTYEGAYIIVTSENADLSDIVFELAGYRLEVDSEGKVYLPSDAEGIYIEPWAFQEKTEKKSVYFSFDGIEVNNGTITVPCTLKNNSGTINIELYNSNETKVEIRKNTYIDFENNEQEIESDRDAEGKLKAPSYEGAYLLVTSDDGVDLTNVKFNISGQEVLIDNNGKVMLPDVQYIGIDKYCIKSVNTTKTNVTVNATATGGNFECIRVNDIEFTNGELVNSVNETKEVEDLDEDRFVISVEPGKIITKIKLNGQETDLTEQCTNTLDFEIPHEDTYNIEITCDKDPYYLPSIRWSYGEENPYGPESLIEHGKLEFVSVQLPDGETVYDYEELCPIDEPGIGRHPKHEEAYLMFDEEDNFGELDAQEGSTVTLKLIPDKGYKVSSLTLNGGVQLVPDPNVENQYTVVMPEHNLYLSGLIEEIQTYFDVTSPKFGAIPNDNEDDFNAIYNALKMAKTTDETITVYIPAGEYTISRSLVIYSNTKLILDQNAVIRSTSSENMDGMVFGAHIDEEDTHGGYTRLENIEISGGTWDRASDSNVIAGIFTLQHGQNINIHDLTVKNCTDHMINISADKDVNIKNIILQNHIPYTGNSSEFWGEHTLENTNRYRFVEAIHTDFAGEGESGALPLDNTICENITIENCKFDGVLSGVGTHHESGYKAKNVTVKNCEFTNMQNGEAINAWSFDSLTVTGNTLTNSNVGIIAIESTGTVYNNSFTVSGDSSDYGIIHLENSEFEVNNNTIQNASKYSLFISGGKATITGNTIDRSGSDGIKVENAVKLKINNNIISNITRYPIFIKNCEGQNIVSENTITALSNANSGNSAILIEKSGNANNVEKNNISGNFDYDIYLSESNGAINNNTLDACRANAISTDNSTVTISQNKITNAAFDAIHLNNSNSTVSLNTITNTTKNAIYAINGKTNIANNTIDKTGTDGIRIDYLSEININNNIIKNIERYGIFTSNSSQSTTISSNEVEGNNAQVGIFIEKCSGTNLIEKNNVKCGSLAGISAFKCTGTISENTVTGCTGDALQTMGDDTNIATFTIKDNTLITASQQNFDLRLYTYSKECVIKNNIFGTRGLKAVSDATYTLDGFTGIKEENGSLVYYKNGTKDTSTGLVKYEETWYYIKDGVVDTSYTGLVRYSGSWFYVQKGVLIWGVNTLVKYNGVWFYIKNSMIDWNYTGLFKYSGSWFYIEGGQLKWGANTLVKYNGVWFYINNSMIDWNYTGLFKYNGSWFYIQGGQLKWGANTLAKYNGAWFYINNSMIDWNYTGLFKYNGSTFYIQQGQLKWGYNGKVNYNGKVYNVVNSTVV